MSESFTPPLARPAHANTSERLAWIALLVVLAIGTPQFLRMPLTNDPVYFDLQADLVRRGGVLYRDMVEPNAPGVVWIHRLVRPIVGDSSEGLRVFDWLVFAATAGLLSWNIRRLTRSAAAAVGAAAAMFGFYLSLAEWSHCQRDIWLLLPAVAGTTLRIRQMRRVRSGGSPPWTLVRDAALEGLVWGAGIWLKPHLLLMTCAVWLAGAWATRGGRRLVFDAAGLLAGGLAAGLLGVLWLKSSGAWPYFWENVTRFAPEYAAAGRKAWTYSGFLAMVFRLAPWGLLHLIAAPVALRWIADAGRRPSDAGSRSPDVAAARGAWAALYVAWTLQGLFLQILFDYVHVPGILLAVALIALAGGGGTLPRRLVRPAVAVFAVLAFWASPLPNLERLARWPECVTGPNSPELHNALRQIQEPDWEALEGVAQFLERQAPHDGDVICYGNHLVHLYPRLAVHPTNRFVYQAHYLQNMPQRRDELRRDLQEHPPRFLVSDLTTVLGLGEFAGRPGADGPHSLPPGVPEKFLRSYPLRYPIVYRAGGLLVHRYATEGDSSPSRPAERPPRVSKAGGS